jgi:hypothetical protein
MESYLDSKKFQEGMKKVGPKSDYKYRSSFDPIDTMKLKCSQCKSTDQTEVAKIREGSYILNEEFQEDIKKVGPDSDYKYRSIFDPISSSELKCSRCGKSLEPFEELA